MPLIDTHMVRRFTIGFFMGAVCVVVSAGLPAISPALAAMLA